MGPLSQNDVESELSYAYLHAVASVTGVVCSNVTRLEDNSGYDATLTGWGPFSGFLEEVDLKVQLKATIKTPTEIADHWSYSFQGMSGYNKLRSEYVATPYFLVVLFLPPEPADWLYITDDALTLRRCAYWMSLRGAPESSNTTSQTVYLPRQQRFGPNDLLGLMDKLSHGSHHPNFPRFQEVNHEA